MIRKSVCLLHFVYFRKPIICKPMVHRACRRVTQMLYCSLFDNPHKQLWHHKVLQRLTLPLQVCQHTTAGRQKLQGACTKLRAVHIPIVTNEGQTHTANCRNGSAEQAKQITATWSTSGSFGRLQHTTRLAMPLQRLCVVVRLIER